jgi:hypothetical protein
MAAVLCSALASMVWPRSTVRFAGTSDDSLVDQSRPGPPCWAMHVGGFGYGFKWHVDERIRVDRSVSFPARSHSGEGEMRRRWTAAGMLVAEQHFRRIIGYRDLAMLVVAIGRYSAQ